MTTYTEPPIRPSDENGAALIKSRRHIHFVTGKLAQRSLRRVVEPLSVEAGFDYSIDVLPITVAALMTPEWIAKRVKVPEQATEVMLPGYCDGDLSPLSAVCGCTITVGPHDLRALPDHFGGRCFAAEGYGSHNIEIIAEINHAPRLSITEIIRQASELKRHGADVIDVGCEPGGPWKGIKHAVSALRNEGMRVSIDSFHPVEVELAVEAGAELVLSVNAANRDYAVNWQAEVVAIPDEPSDPQSLDATIECLSSAGVQFRIDPILEPIGCGFTESLQRYFVTRARYPDHEMMMGIGNLTELTDVDSAGVNVVLLAICQELSIRSVLTTQVINWARTSVLECDYARRLVHYAVTQATIPKHVDPNLVMLRDVSNCVASETQLDELALEIKDHNYRLFVTEESLHILGGGRRWSDADAFVLFDKLLASKPTNIDASHAFYLGYELAKATTAMTLAKQYRQDEALDWGFLTRTEESHLDRREKRN